VNLEGQKCEALPQRGLEIVIFIGINHGRINISQKSIVVRKTSVSHNLARLMTLASQNMSGWMILKDYT
jgi:hypothetical protein